MTKENENNNPEEELNEEEENKSEEEESGDENDPSKLSADDIKKMKAALKKANEEAKNYRLELKKLKQEKETDEEKKVREAVEAKEAEITTKFVARLAHTEARAAFKEAGYSGNVDRFLKLLSLDEISLDDDGDLVGLDEQIEAIKADFPEVFTKEKKKSAPKGDHSNKPPVDQTPKSSAEKIAKMIQG